MPLDEVVDFQRQRQRDADARLQLLMNTRADEHDRATAMNATAPLGPPTPTAAERGGGTNPYAMSLTAPIESGAKAVADVAHEGLTNFVSGLMRRSPTEGGFGQQALGVLQLLAALPAGAGAAVKKAFADFAPGMEQAVAIKGGKAGEMTPAGMITSTLAAPSLLLDPKIQEAIKSNPQAVAEMLNKDLTYGDLMDIITQFVAPVAVGKALRGRATPGVGDPGGPAAPPPGTPDVSARISPAPMVGTHFTVPPGGAEPMTPRTMADLLREAWGGALPGETRPRDPRIRTLEDLQREAGATPPAAAAGTPEMTVDLSVAKRPYEEPPAILRAAEPPPVSSSLVDDLGRRVDLAPSMVDPVVEREYQRALNRTKLSEPSAVTPEPAAAAPTTPAGELTSAIDHAMLRAGDVIREELPKYFEHDWRGSIDPRVLAQMAVGAAVGGTYGTTPEEHFAGAIAGLVGGPVAARLSMKLGRILQESGLATRLQSIDPEGAGLTTFTMGMDPSKFRGTSILPKTRKALAIAKSDIEGESWYWGAREELQRVLPGTSRVAKRGTIPDAELMTDLLTVTSPGILTTKSIDVSLQAMELWKAGKSADQIARTISPGGIAHTKIKRDVGRIFKGELVTDILSEDAMKLRNFNLALKGDPGAVVVDRWIWRLFYPEQWQAGKLAATKAGKDYQGYSGTNAQYRAVAEWITDTAKTLGMQPADLQAKLWVGIKLSVGDTEALAPFRELLLIKKGQREATAFEGQRGIKRFPGMSSDGQATLESVLGLTEFLGGGLVGAELSDNTPEAKIAGVLAGALGARVAAKLAPRLAQSVMDSGLLHRLSSTDPQGAGLTTVSMGFDPTKWRKRPAVQPAEDFQPNYARIDAPTDVLRTMKNIHRAVADQITEAMKKPTSHDETQKAAWDLLQSGEVTAETVLNNAPIEIDKMPAYGKAVRDLSVGAAGETVRAAQRLLRGEPVAPGDVFTAAALSGELATKARSFQTRGGQTVEAFKIRAEDPMLRQAGTTPERIAELRDRMAQGLSEHEFAQMILADASPERIQTFTSALKILPGAILEFMYGSMFSGLTIFRNVLGNFVMQPAAIAARAGAAAIADVKEGVGFRQASRVQWSEPAVMMNAWWNETGKQLMLARSWKDWQEHAASMGKLQETHSAGKIAALADTLEPGVAADILRGIGTVVRKPLEVMNGTDASARAIARRMEISAQAQRQAAAEGRVGGDFATRVAELETDPAQFTSSARRDINEFEMEQTFTKDLEGRIGSALQAGPSGDWLNLAYRATVFPVFRTAIRVAESQLEYSGNPALTLLAKRFREDWWSGGARRQIAESKMALGGTMFAAFTYLALNDWVTGSAPDDPKKRAIWGKPEISFWDPLSGKYRSYKGMEPLTGWIRNAADMVQYAKGLPEADYLKLFAAHVLVNFNNLESENWWLGLSDITKVIRGTHGKDSQVEAALDVIRKRLALWSPGFLAEVEKGLDPGMRRSQPSGAIDNPAQRELEALIARYKTRTPLFSTEKDEAGFDKYPIARDPLTGRHIVNESWPFTMMSIVPDKRSRARDEIDRLQPPGIAELPDHIGGAGDKGSAGINPPKLAPAAGVLLGRNEKDRWVEIMTQGTKDVFGHTLMDSLEALVTSSEYRGTAERPVSDFRKRELLSHRWNWFRDQAEHQLLRERPDLNAAVLSSKAEPKIQRQSPTDQPQLRKTYEGLIQSLTR